MDNHVVIMAGGVGSRFWPLSTPEYPKQFIDILGCGRTLIQLTVDRFKGIAPMSNFWVVTNAAYVDIVKQQIPDMPASHILAEPAARNTAPCIAWACWSIKREDPSANVVVTPADAVVMNPEEFRRVIKNALAFTDSNNAIVTIGIKPSRPETGYGYVEADLTLSSSPEGKGSEVCKVASFKEKPDFEIAEKYLKAGNYLWNAGIFVWNLETISDCIKKYKPNIAADMDKIMATGDVKNIFPQCEKISIDFAVMEPAAADGKVYTHPADFGWSDLGNWASLHDKLQKDTNGNGVVGNIKLYECSNCVVHAEDAKKVVLQGLDGYIVSEKNGQILVCKRSEEQRIREFSTDV
ncbi:MAG: mannose-1-phosphate guanylyltransferase [Bacteroidales bacterium]|nr:mannose-1-phosphate guanylyltransferase [Bacteroidales bacterium]